MKRNRCLKIKKELTPLGMSCGIGACPAVFETNNESYLIVGKTVDASKLGIKNRLGKDESLIEVPKGIIDKKL